MAAWPDGPDVGTESTGLMAPRALKRTGVVAGVAAGVVGIAYATERALVARLRHREDPDADSRSSPSSTPSAILDSHDDGTLCTIPRRGAADRVRARRHALVARVGEAVRLRARCRVPRVAFDRRGHGESNVGESGHSVDNLADDVRSVLESLDLHDAVLVGHSMGGMAMQAFVIRHPTSLGRARARAWS